MINKPQFSIIIPIYNVADYLEKTINSVLEQTYDDFELILVDDGSPDECPLICDRYKDKDPRIIVIHKQNGGLVSARQAGASIASGYYAVCLDGDDWLHKNTLSKIAEVVKTNNHPDIICFGIIKSKANEEVETIVRNRKGYYSRDNIVDEVFPMLIQKEDATYFAPSLCGKAINMEIYQKQQMSVPRDIVIGEDGACTIPCIYRANSIFIMDDYLYYYRQNPASVTKNRKELSWNIPIINSNHIKNTVDIDMYNFREQLYRKICHDTFLVIVTSFYSRDNYLQIRNRIKRETKATIISEAINKASFSHSIKASLMMFLMRNKLYLPFKVYSLIR